MLFLRDGCLSVCLLVDSSVSARRTVGLSVCAVLFLFIQIWAPGWVSTNLSAHHPFCLFLFLSLCLCLSFFLPQSWSTETMVTDCESTFGNPWKAPSREEKRAIWFLGNHWKKTKERKPRKKKNREKIDGQWYLTPLNQCTCLCGCGSEGAAAQ